MNRGFIFFACFIFLSNVGESQVTGCITDAQCRFDNNCNAYCDVQSNTCLSNSSVLVCPFNSVCYESVGKCFPKCTQSTDCLAYSFLLHKPYQGVCNATTGKCSDCLVTTDCLPWSSTTCGAFCSFSPLTKEYLCFNGNVCKNSRVCGVDPSNNSSFSCVPSSATHHKVGRLYFLLLSFFYFCFTF